jgi:hypothetical protein
MAPGKGKQMCVVLDDDEVSSHEDEPLQKRLWQFSGAGSAVHDEATDKRAMEEAVAKRAVEERAAEEAAAKAAAAEGSPAPPRQPNVPIGVFRNLGLSRFLSFLWLFISLLPFLPKSSPSGAATMTITTTADVAVGATLGLAPDGEPRTPGGVPEDVVESEGEPKVAPEPVPEVVLEEAPAEVAMIAISWCVSTTFVGAPQGRGFGGCHRHGNGGGPGASLPLCVG